MATQLNSKNGGHGGPLPGISGLFSIALSLSFVLLPVRAAVMELQVLMPPTPANIPAMMLMAYYDVAYVASITVVFAILCFLFRKSPKAQRRLTWIFFFLSFFSLLIGILNIEVVKKLGTPFNFRWLYYSDFLMSHETLHAIMVNLTPGFILVTVALLIAFVILVFVFRRLVHFLQSRMRGSSMGYAALALMVLYFPLAKHYVEQPKWARARLENPVVFFVKSLTNRAPMLLTKKTTVGFDDFMPVNEVSAAKAPDQIRNLILFVFESLPVEYVDVYGSRFGATPTLARYRKQAAIFKNMYAQTPATASSLAAILCGIQPWITYRSITVDFPDVPLPCISSELQKQGYRTGFFNSAANSFNRIEEFVSHRGFQLVEDYHQRRCSNRIRLNDRDYSPGEVGGSDDGCTVDSLIRWLKEDPEKPFFGMLWTMMTHYPYYNVGDPKNYGVDDPMLNRYLNALHWQDAALGKLLEWLETEGLSDSTLVIVVGDHGEAFGRHNQIGHGLKIYEETIHVPLMLINGKLFHGEEYSTIGMLCDIAPTAMRLLQLPASNGWQGRDLFGANRTERAYFGVFWSDRIFGYREDTYKFIFNETRNTYEIYDLQADPLETKNLAKHFPDRVQQGVDRLAAWVQFQDRFMKQIIKSEKRPSPAATEQVPAPQM